MIILSPSENGPLFKVKSKIRAPPIQDNGEISNGRCHDDTLLSPVVMGREHDPVIGRISYFRKTIPINMRKCWVSRPLTYLDRPFSCHLRAKRDLMSCVYPAVSYGGIAFPPECVGRDFASSIRGVCKRGIRLRI